MTTGRSKKAVLAEIETFQPRGDWRPLDHLLDELWTLGVSADDADALFCVFERFPDDDGAGLLWSIVHGLESRAFDYEPALRRSLARRPCMMGEIMLDRLERSKA